MSASTKKVRDVTGLHPESHRVRKELAEKSNNDAQRLFVDKKKLVWRCKNLFLVNRMIEFVALLHFACNIFITLLIIFLNSTIYFVFNNARLIVKKENLNKKNTFSSGFGLLNTLYITTKTKGPRPESLHFSLKNIGEFSSLHGWLIILTGALRSEINESSFTFASVRSWGIECFTREESEETLPFT